MAKGSGGSASAGRGTGASSGGLSLSQSQRDLIQNGPSFINEAGRRESDKIAVSTLGLRTENAFPIGLSGRKRRLEVPLNQISLGRGELNRERLLNAASALKGGVKARGKKIQPIRVAQTPSGRFVVQGDGNHRIAALLLMGYGGKVPVLATMQQGAR